MASSFETHRFAMLLRMRSQTLMVRSAPSRVSNHEASGDSRNDSSELENALAKQSMARQAAAWIASSMALLAMTAGVCGRRQELNSAPRQAPRRRCGSGRAPSPGFRRFRPRLHRAAAADPDRRARRSFSQKMSRLTLSRASSAAQRETLELFGSPRVRSGGRTGSRQRNHRDRPAPSAALSA